MIYFSQRSQYCPCPRLVTFPVFQFSDGLDNFKLSCKRCPLCLRLHITSQLTQPSHALSYRCLVIHTNALWETRQTLPACSREAFYSIPDDSRGLSWGWYMSRPKPPTKLLILAAKLNVHLVSLSFP